MRKICLTFSTVLFLCVNAMAQNEVGKIISLKGTASLRLVTGKVEALTEKNFVRSLQPNQKLRVNKNGQMQILLCNGARPFIPSDRWYPVPATIICSSPADSPQQRVIEDKFAIGARHRGPNVFILFPIESEAIIDTIRPETAIFRWASSIRARVDLSISVVGAENRLWEKSGIPGEDGSFTDDGLKKFLEGVREKQPDARLQLKVQVTFNRESTTNTAIFQLISKAEDKALQQEIANLKEENELLAHLFRAEIYRRYNLLIEAAGEYEEALKLSPESIELLRATAVIEDQAGNLKRRDALENYIEKSGAKPLSQKTPTIHQLLYAMPHSRPT